MASFTIPCPKCVVVPFAHLGLNSQTQQRNALGLKKSLSFGSLSSDSAPNGIQVRVFFVKCESGFEVWINNTMLICSDFGRWWFHCASLIISCVCLCNCVWVFNCIMNKLEGLLQNAQFALFTFVFLGG